METITFKRGQKVTDALDIGGFRVLKDNLNLLNEHDAVSFMYIKNSKAETVLVNGQYHLYTGKILFLSLDTGKTDYDKPDEFLINYLPVKYFRDVVFNETSRTEGSSFDLGDLRKLPMTFSITMYIKEEYNERFPVKDFF